MLLYGIGYNVRLNFGLWLLKNLSEERAVRVADDQFANPTLVDHVAYGILQIVELDRKDIYHLASPELVSRYEFALALARIFEFNKKLVMPVKTAQLKQAAMRPLRSGFITLRATTDLNIRMNGVERGLTIFKNQLSAQLQAAAKSEKE